ncbi:SRPBCC family protein [Flavobacterium sp. HJJ]|uniref:SRPBCC family protein n=1 Tax=Flavobacterium sp. HJJ TaxID=2783792 RepID=UPI00188D7BEC|nr:SRPBCC family protein [Flavobacterium sp. HJJ]MBF4472152.1 SRPBCC family protein [Flavobacterium sp. HJJ]
MITVKCKIDASIDEVWKLWTTPEHITKWNYASDGWHTPYAENDLRTGGKFKSTMASKDGTMSFDFEGEYTKMENHSLIEYKMADGRKVDIYFVSLEDGVEIIESFDPENINSEEMQREGWQTILDNFKKYAECL